jgi:hypothetical protein
MGVQDIGATRHLLTRRGSKAVPKATQGHPSSRCSQGGGNLVVSRDHLADGARHTDPVDGNSVDLGLSALGTRGDDPNRYPAPHQSARERPERCAGGIS